MCWSTMARAVRRSCSPWVIATRFLGAYPVGSKSATIVMAALSNLGMLVSAVPSASHKKRNLKFKPALRPVAFLGYAMQEEGKWFGEFTRTFVQVLADKPFWSRPDAPRARSWPIWVRCPPPFASSLPECATSSKASGRISPSCATNLSSYHLATP